MIHTTNYINTFIAIADDCPVKSAEIPPQKGDKLTVANIQFNLVVNNPYKFTSDDVIFKVFAVKQNITSKSQLLEERGKFFSKGQACMRSSPLTKRYGWGVHSNAKGKIAIFPAGSTEYETLIKDKAITHVKAMRSKRI
ncbi:MAG: hypothetical protein C0490_23565 [Marivirga sp.]|nr:hypothetical protein [Marivirga sp.]